MVFEKNASPPCPTKPHTRERERERERENEREKGAHNIHHIIKAQKHCGNTLEHDVLVFGFAHGELL